MPFSSAVATRTSPAAADAPGADDAMEETSGSIASVLNEWWDETDVMVGTITRTAVRSGSVCVCVSGV